MSYRDAKLASEMRRRQLEEELAELRAADADRFEDLRIRRIAWWLSIAIALSTFLLAGFRLWSRHHASAEAPARASTAMLRRAADIYLAEDHGIECPRLSDLMASQLIDSSDFLDDAWGTPYRIACYQHELGDWAVMVWSAGPDRIYGSEDDIVR